MDGNKDEALRCIKISESSLESGDKQRALKFVKMAKRSDPTIPTDHILFAIKNLDTSKPIPQRENHHISQRTHQPIKTSINYTEEHVKVVHEIRKNKDYYAILGVEKSSSAEEIERAYKKLSLKIHPDKNKAPGAEKAFKSASEAFNCLSNEQLRWNYDMTGSENYSHTLLNKNGVAMVSFVLVVSWLVVLFVTYICGCLLLDFFWAKIKDFISGIYQRISSWLRSAICVVLTVYLAYLVLPRLTGDIGRY